MSTRFECLEKEWYSLAEVAKGAENLIGYENGACVIKAGIFAELLVKEIMRIEKIEDTSKGKQLECVEMLEEQGILPEHIADILCDIRAQRNQNAHSETKADEEGAEAVMDLAGELAEWFATEYTADPAEESEFIEARELAWKEERHRKELLTEKKSTRVLRKLLLTLLGLLVLGLGVLEVYLIRGL